MALYLKDHTSSLHVLIHWLDITHTSKLFLPNVQLCIELCIFVFFTMAGQRGVDWFWVSCKCYLDLHTVALIEMHIVVNICPVKHNIKTVTPLLLINNYINNVTIQTRVDNCTVYWLRWHIFYVVVCWGSGITTTNSTLSERRGRKEDDG